MPVPMKSFERGLDKLTEIAQEQNAAIGNVVPWPTTAGIPYWASGLSWAGAYNASNPIPANYLPSIASLGGVANNAPALAAPTLCIDTSFNGASYACSTTPTFTPVNGTRIMFIPSVDSLLNATVSVNSGRPASIMTPTFGGGTTILADQLIDGQVVSLVYRTSLGGWWQIDGGDGTRQVNEGGTGATTAAGALANLGAAGTDLANTFTLSQAFNHPLDSTGNTFFQCGLTTPQFCQLTFQDYAGGYVGYVAAYGSGATSQIGLTTGAGGMVIDHLGKGTFAQGLSTSSFALNGGTSMTGNQGTGAYVQHSDGTGTNSLAAFNADGSTKDSGITVTGSGSSQVVTAPGSFAAPTVVLSGATGTQCLHEVSGSILPTGSDCGSGGGGGLPTGWVDPVTSYNAAGVATTTTGTISASSNSLVVASSTGWTAGMGIAVSGSGAKGGVYAFTVTAPGSYTVCPTAFSFTGGGGASAAGTPTCHWTPSTGVYTVTGGIITNVGSGYTTAPTIGFTGGTGSGAAATAIITSELVTTVSVISGTTFTLAANASTAVSGATIQHDDTAALNAANASGYNVYWRPGTYNVTGPINVSSVFKLLGAGGQTTINNRGRTNNVINVTYSVYSTSGVALPPGPEISGFQIVQDPSITPVSGCGLQWGSGAINPYTEGVRMRDIGMTNTWAGLCAIDGTALNFLHDIRVQNTVSGWGIYYNSRSPGGDNNFDGVSLWLNAGLYIINGATNPYTNLKTNTGGMTTPVIFGSGIIMDQRFDNPSLDGLTTTGCSMDFTAANINTVTITSGDWGGATAFCAPQNVGSLTATGFLNSSSIGRFAINQMPNLTIYSAVPGTGITLTNGTHTGAQLFASGSLADTGILVLATGGTNTIHLSGASSDASWFNNGGCVAIGGTTCALGALEVYGTVATYAESGNSPTISSFSGTKYAQFYYNSPSDAMLVQLVGSATGGVKIQNYTSGAYINLLSTNYFGIGKTPSYYLDVNGDVNTGGVFRTGGTAGVTKTCTTYPTVAGGIVTGC
jgi:hypothetical protein